MATPEVTTNDRIITISDYYYRKTEIDTMMNGKANTSHIHSTATLETDGFLSKEDKSKLDNLSYDTGWQEVTFKSGYSRYNDSTSVYIRRKGDFVELTGMWKTTSTKSATYTPTTFATIPSELKPTRVFSIVCFGMQKNTYMLTVENNSLKWSRYGTDTNVDLKTDYGCFVHCTWII